MYYYKTILLLNSLAADKGGTGLHCDGISINVTLNELKHVETDVASINKKNLDMESRVQNLNGKPTDKLKIPGNKPSKRQLHMHEL